MSIQTTSTSSAEHDWYATRSGLSGQAPLNDHKLAYFASKGIGSNASVRKPLTQLEREWLQTLTGVTSNEISDMWVQAVAGQSLTPGVKIDENKRIFFSSVSGSP